MRESKRVRVLLADDHPIYREGLIRAIKERPDLELIAEVATGREAIESIRELCPDVALVDLNMPDLDGMGVLHAVIRDGLSTRVLFLSASTEGAAVYNAVVAGAAGYLSKDADREAIFDALRKAARGEVVLESRTQTGLVSELRRRAEEPPTQLSKREAEILRLVADGLSAPEIADHLGVGTTTVKTHLQGLYTKLGVSDRAAAVAVAMRTGLLE